jgi:class 3 adenylate cyclase/tetratricopeptide (TPR) repeat protein
VRLCANCGAGNREGARFCDTCGAPLATEAAQREVRRVVTVLFCDVAGSTSLGESVDAEALRALLARYFERMKAIVESHGGSVEKFIGDAVMAVFGVPQVHEDDALRAVRAAAEMRQALPELGLQARIGVNTGEVVTGTEERLVTGDTVNVAARLEQAAEPGAVLLGEPTVALVRDAVEVESIEPLQVKGKAEPLTAYHMLRVLEAPERRHGVLFVGRERELALLKDAWARVVAELCCELFTVVGDAGIGKSRLVAEFLSATGTRVVSGRCLPYGDGITYRPVVEVIKQLNAVPSDSAAAASIRSLLGETREGTSAEEIAWAFRRLLEEQAPLVCVFDDIQWGEKTFLDLVEQFAELSTGAPLLIVCLARREFAERRPEWPVALRLEPLRNVEIEQLIPARLGRGVRGQIARKSGGNPLFVTEMVAMAAEAEGEVVVPPTLRALLAARLDGLESGERVVLERGAVEGEIFHRSAVHALASEELPVTRCLLALMRKEVIRPHASQLPGDDAFRFRHLILRDVAYDGLSKASRADLHERFAAFLDVRAPDLVELDEIVGYHLEQSYRCRVELGRVGQRERKLAAEATTRLEAAGHRSFALGDPEGCGNLLARATSLLQPDDPARLGLLPTLGAALFEAGRLTDADQVLTEAIERSTGNKLLEARARVERQFVRLQTDTGASVAESENLVDSALRVFERHEDDLGQCRAWCLRALSEWVQGQVAKAEEAWRRGAEHARQAGEERELFEILDWRASAAPIGPTPVMEAIKRCSEIREEVQGSPLAVAQMLPPFAELHAMQGDFGAARSLIREADAIHGELGRIYTVALAHFEASVEMLAGHPAVAEERLRRAYDRLDEMGEKALFATTAAMLAEALYRQGRFEEAETLCWASRNAAAAEDPSAQVVWRGVQAKILARRGNHVDAVRLAREAVSLGDATDMVNLQGDALVDLAEVLIAAGDSHEAHAVLEQALDRYERKKNLAMVAQVRERLKGLRDRARASPRV